MLELHLSADFRDRIWALLHTDAAELGCALATVLLGAVAELVMHQNSLFIHLNCFFPSLLGGGGLGKWLKNLSI